MMELMCKLAAVGIVAAILGLVLRKQTPELELLLLLAAGIWMLTAVADGLGAVLSFAEELTALTGVEEELLQPVFKTVALSMVTKLTAELCRSSGSGGLAAFVELSGAILAVCVSVPLIRAVALLMGEMLG